jgi:N-acetylmuramoyl-L-alanine amidase
MSAAALRASLIYLPVAALLGVALAAQTPQEHYVRELRFWTLGEVTRVAVETSHEAEFRSVRLGNPDRLFFDLKGLRPRPGLRPTHTITVNDRLLKQIRMAETQPRVTRIVLDLAAPADFTTSQLTNPDRLIIELRAAGAAAPSDVAAGQAPAASSQDNPEREAAKPVAAEPAAASAKPVVAESKTPPGPAAAARRDSRGDRSLIRALGLKVGRVVLDPGHGGQDTGSISPGGLVEKELVLDVAKRLGALISERMDSEVIYTRTEDVSVPLETRTELANQQKADLFISLHANSSRLRNIAGPETYYLNFTTSASALEVAARENAASEKTIHELQELVQKITLKAKVQESREFAAAIQRSLHAGLWKSTPAVKDRGVKKAPFVVLIGASMPSVLVEIDFMSNSRAERLLKTPAHRQKVAEALFEGVSRYASSLSHFQVGQAKTGQ